MKTENLYKRCGFDRRYEDDRRNLYNVMPLGYDKRKKRIERRTPIERRDGWGRHTRWGSVGPDRKSSPFQNWHE